jgi:hypothetical protein
MKYLGGEMQANQPELLEQRMNRIAKMAVWIQFSAFSVAISILYFQPLHYRELGQIFSITVLALSFVISRMYIYTWRDFETFKSFPPDELKARKREYFTKFFSAYGLWVMFSYLFSRA